MYKILKLLILCSFYYVKCSDDMKTECNSSIVIDLKTSKRMNIDEACKDSVCIIRYCMKHNHVYRKKSKNCPSLEDVGKITNSTVQFPNIDVYKNSYDTAPTEISEKKFTDFRHVAYANRRMYGNNCSQGWSPESDDVKYVFREDGSLVRQDYIYGDILIDKQKYMVKFQVDNSDGQWIVKKYVKFLNSKHTEDYTPDIVNAIGMAISTFFLMLVLVMYGVIPKLRTLAGVMLMATVTSLAVGFAVKAAQMAIQLSDSAHSITCQIMCPIWFYALLASFFWMNAMSFDCFWVFCNLYKNHHRNNPKRQKRTFCKYCAYAFGVPLVIVIFAITVDLIRPKHIEPPYFNLCFPSKFSTFYLYIPIVIVLAFNLLLFVMTSVKICLTQKSVSKLFKSSESATTGKEKARFVFYIKLTFVMGITWILDLVELVVVAMPQWLKYILNSNVFIGLAIFIIQLCNRDVLAPLGRKLSVVDRFGRSIRSSVSSSSGREGRKKSSVIALCPSPTADSASSQFSEISIMESRPVK